MSHPIYIPSKGRWKNSITAKALDRMNCPYKVVVEPQEYEMYADHIAKNKLLELPFSNLGQGSIPARNWIWEHALSQGATYHWCIDDNIVNFYRLNRNTKYLVETPAIFRAAEAFAERYENVAISGFNYLCFCKNMDKVPAYYLNTRVYSMILIRNDIPYRWRGRYNEDTDLSLRALKDGWCTVQINAFLGDKATTMKMKGGNTDELYQGDGRLKMAQSLVEQHPDVTTITWKFNRWQHQVDYRKFKKNRLIRKDGLVLRDKIDNFGMILIDK